MYIPERYALASVGLAALVLVMAPVSARAQALSSDIELLHPVAGPDALPGLTTANRDKAGTFRLQTTMQFEDSPLVLYAADVQQREEIGAVVHRRITTHIGVSAALSDRIRLAGTIPMHGQWGSEVPDLAADGFGMGDFRLNGSYAIARTPIGEAPSRAGVRPAGRSAGRS